MSGYCNTAVVLRKEGSGLTRTWLRAKKIRVLNGYARMAELADAPDSKSGSRKRVGVRPSLWAPSVHSAATGLTRGFCGLGGDRTVRTSESNSRRISPVDMSDIGGLYFFRRARVMKKVLSHDVRPILISVIAFHSLILTKSHHGGSTCVTCWH